MKYRADIDGLRALAVLPVVLFHLGVPGMSGGFVGVDVFFVLSGFLITTLLLKDLDGGTFSIVTFYERRIRRILPALFVTMAAALIGAFALLLPNDVKSTGKEVLSTAFFGSNLLFWRETGYFDAPAHTKPLLHTWSLAVEEQFYISYPILLWAATRWFRKLRTPMLAALFVGSAVVSQALVHRSQSAAFYLLHSRAWELLAGGILAIEMPAAKPGRWEEILGVAGVAAILLSVALYSSATPFPGLSAALPVGGTVAVVAVGRGPGVGVSRALSWRPLVFVGQISYSLYLWHWPLIVFARYYLLRPLRAVEMVALGVVMLLVAVLSWRFVERPVRSGWPAKKALFAAAGVAIAGFGALGYVGYAKAASFSKRVVLELPPGRDGYHHKVCFLDTDQTFADWRRDQCTFPAKTAGAPVVLLWGDSYAAQYTQGLASLQPSLGFTLVELTAEGCAPFLDYDEVGEPNCRALNREVVALIEKDRPAVVVLAARWNRFRDTSLIAEKADETVAKLRAAGAAVVVIGESPVYGATVPQISALLGSRGLDRHWFAPINGFYADKPLADIADRRGARFFPPRKALCEGDRCRIEGDGGLLNIDEGHLSDAGSVFLAAAMAPDLASALGN